MPGFNRPPEHWLTDRLRTMDADVSGLKKQATEYVVDENQNCVAIIGNLEHAPLRGEGTEATGLTGWGIAVKNSGTWGQLKPNVAGDWNAAAFENSWKNFSSDVPAAYLKDSLGWVHLRGHIASGVTEKTAFTLPVGYRSAFSPMFVIAGSNSGTIVPAICYLHTDGSVIPAFGSAVSFLSLNTITFLAEA